MKTNSRGIKEILKKVAAVICAPFFIVFLMLFAISSLLLCLVFVIFAKLDKDVKLPHFFNFLFDASDDLYYDSYENQSEGFEEFQNLEEFEDCNF